MHFLYKGKYMLSQEKLKYIFDGLKNYWSTIEIKDINSIFYKDKFIEKEFKKLCPKSRGVTLQILKAIKLSFVKGGRCYYTQRELAKKFKVKQQTVQQSISLIEKVCKTKFLRLPKSVVNYTLSNKSYFRQMLIPPSLYGKLTVDENMLTVDEGMLTVDTIHVDSRWSEIPNNSIKLGTVPIYLYYSLFNIFYSYSCTSYKNEEKNHVIESPDFLGNDFSFLKEKSMKHTLTVKKNKPSFIVSYDSFGLHPKQFMNYIEMHSVLEKWIEELIENNIVPKIENTKMFLSSWNNFGNPRFVRHKINPKSNAFKFICLAITYRMWSEKINIDDIEKAIEKFDLIASKQGKLMHIKKLNCLSTFLWNSKAYGEKDFFKLCILDEDIVLTEYYNKVIPPKRAFERVRKLFGNIFFHDKPKLGKESFKKNYKRFIDFTNEMIDNHRTNEMGRFVEDYENNLIEGFTDYIQSYFSYVYRKIEKSNNLYVWSPQFILGQHTDFALWLSKQEGWEDFMKVKKVIEKPKKHKLMLDK